MNNIPVSCESWGGGSHEPQHHDGCMESLSNAYNGLRIGEDKKDKWHRRGAQFRCDSMTLSPFARRDNTITIARQCMLRNNDRVKHHRNWYFCLWHYLDGLGTSSDALLTFGRYLISFNSEYVCPRQPWYMPSTYYSFMYWITLVWWVNIKVNTFVRELHT